MHFFLTGILSITLFLSGCLDDSSEPITRNTTSQNIDQTVNAWIWVYQSDSNVLNVYNAVDGTIGNIFMVLIMPNYNRLILLRIEKFW
jgi:hypothetical protein